jgi:hypothetical protein
MSLILSSVDLSLLCSLLVALLLVLSMCGLLILVDI